ncbi:MAG TPA: GYD domain-containing protein [Candidatus Binatia bacterium]|nr:GYD domain-containing protein [Candidatus Binatia bacterium]
MATYISLIRFTQKGIESIKEGPKRLDAAKERFRAAGGQLKAFYLVTGQYDAVAISEAPDDETVAKLALAIGSMGMVRTETLRAFTEDEYRKIVAAIS